MPSLRPFKSPVLLIGLSLTGCLQHRGLTDATIDGYHYYVEGGPVAEIRLPPPDRNDPWPFVSDTPLTQPDLPTLEARRQLTAALEGQRNLTQRATAEDGELDSPDYTAPGKRGSRDPLSEERTLPDTAVSPADAVNAEFLAKLRAAEQEEAQRPVPTPPVKPAKKEKERRGIALPQGIYWPWSAFKEWLDAPAKPKPAKATAKVEPKKSVVRAKKPVLIWPVQPLPLPEIIYDAHDLAPPDKSDLPIVPSAPPQPISEDGFDVPEQAVSVTPDFDLKDPEGVLIRFNAQSDVIAANQDERLSRLAWERGGRKILITGYGGTFGDKLGLTAADQIEEVKFGLLRARAVADRLVKEGVPASDISIAGQAIGDGVRVRYLG